VARQTAAEVARQQCASYVGTASSVVRRERELVEQTLHTAQKYGQKILQLLELTLAQPIFAIALYISLLLLMLLICTLYPQHATAAV